MGTIDGVPDEIIRQILQHVPPEEAYNNLPLVSKKFKRIASDPLLWKHYCQTSFRFWQPSHRLDDKLAARASRTAWRDLWRRRKYRNDLVARLLDEIISTKVARNSKIGRICELGYDAKDYLLAQIETPHSAEDALARRLGYCVYLLENLITDD